MDLVKLGITAAFIRRRTDLTWREVRFGIESELLAPGAATDLAASQVAVDEDPAPALVELAGLSAEESPQALVESLAAAAAAQTPEAVRSKWLYLVLAWIFEHQQGYPEPLQMVGEVYADFGYPEAIAGFVPYMPMAEPDLGSKEANERRLFEKWKAYLDAASHEYGP